MAKNTTHNFSMPAKPQLCRRANVTNYEKHSSSVVLFLSVILIFNLCSFRQDFELFEPPSESSPMMLASNESTIIKKSTYLVDIQSYINLVMSLYCKRIRSERETVRFTQVEALMLGKMAKVWYIKKKIKKLGKKLKKHTIALPVFTAIPIYEHSY